MDPFHKTVMACFNYCKTAEKPGNVKKVAAVLDVCCSSTDQSYTTESAHSATVQRNFGAVFFSALNVENGVEL